MNDHPLIHVYNITHIHKERSLKNDNYSHFRKLIKY